MTEYEMIQLCGKPVFPTTGRCLDTECDYKKHLKYNKNLETDRKTLYEPTEELPVKNFLSECFDGKMRSDPFSVETEYMYGTVAVGPHHIVQTRRFGMIDVYNKETQVLESTFASSMVFGIEFTPDVHYDPYMNRFILYQIWYSTGELYIAVSRSSSANSGYDAYVFEFKTKKSKILTHIGSWDNGLYLATFSFDELDSGNLGTKVSRRLIVIDRHSLVEKERTDGLPGISCTPMLMYATINWNIDDDIPTYHIMSPNASATLPPKGRRGCFIAIPNITTRGGKPGNYNISFPHVLTAFEVKLSFKKRCGVIRKLNIDVDNYAPRSYAKAAQKGTNFTMYYGGPMDLHLALAQYSNVCGEESYSMAVYNSHGKELFITVFRLWVSCGKLHILNRYNTLSGKDKGLGRYSPGLAVNKFGDILLPYYKSDKDSYISTMFVSRYVSDKEGLLTKESLLVESVGYITVFERTIPFTVVDTDGRTFYVSTQYQKPGENNWAIKICKIKL